MSEPYEAVAALIQDARRLDYAAERNATAMAQLLVGKLRHVRDHSALDALKREIAAYNRHTGEWRKP